MFHFVSVSFPFHRIARHCCCAISCVRWTLGRIAQYYIDRDEPCDDCQRNSYQSLVLALDRWGWEAVCGYHAPRLPRTNGPGMFYSYYGDSSFSVGKRCIPNSADASVILKISVLKGYNYEDLLKLSRSPRGKVHLRKVTMSERRLFYGLLSRVQDETKIGERSTTIWRPSPFQWAWSHVNLSTAFALVRVSALEVSTLMRPSIFGSCPLFGQLKWRTNIRQRPTRRLTFLTFHCVLWLPFTWAGGLLSYRALV